MAIQLDLFDPPVNEVSLLHRRLADCENTCANVRKGVFQRVSQMSKEYEQLKIIVDEIDRRLALYMGMTKEPQDKIVDIFSGAK